MRFELKKQAQDKLYSLQVQNSFPFDLMLDLSITSVLASLVSPLGGHFSIKMGFYLHKVPIKSCSSHFYNEISYLVKMVFMLTQVPA